MAPLVDGVDGKKWIQNVAAGCYATASSSGALFFALNFGDQGGAPVTSWVFRACVIQGTQVCLECVRTLRMKKNLLHGAQQVYIALLWCWGEALARMNESGTANTSLVVTNPALTTSIGVVVAVLMWMIGSTLFLGLPDYYRQTPGFVPSFLSGIVRRKIVLWFFVMVVSLTPHQPQILPALNNSMTPTNNCPR